MQAAATARCERAVRLDWASSDALEERRFDSGSGFQKLCDHGADAGVQLLEGDFLAIGKAHAIAIGTVIETHKDHVFARAQCRAACKCAGIFSSLRRVSY